MKTNLIIRSAATGALMLSVLLAGCTRSNPTEAAAGRAAPPTAPANEVVLAADSPQLQRIALATVEARRVCTDEVEAPGKVEANPTRLSRVVMPVAGRVMRVMVNIGDAVTQGQPLLTVVSPDVSAATAAYQQSASRVHQTRAALAKADADLSRVHDLFAHRAIAQKDVLSFEAARVQAQSDLEQAQAALSDALRRLQIFGLKPGDFNQEIIVRAPIAGKVLDISVAPGELRNDTSTPLLSIADLSSVYVAADVPEDRIRLVEVGEQVEVRLTAYPAEVFHGHVARIADTVDPQTRTIKVRAELRNPGGRLRPEMFAQIRHEDAFATLPTIPAAALIQSEGHASVWREKRRGVFEQVEVKTGRRDEDRIAILGGLSPGDRVVVDGVMLLRSGS